MRRMAIACATVALGIRMVAAATGPLFKATFDAWNTVPDMAVDKGVLKEGIDPELQLRMCADVRGADVRGNALSLTVPEYVAYPCGGNFRPDRGTVLFWVRPMNYTLSDLKYFQPYFSVESNGYQFYIYKYHQRPDQVTVYMNYRGRSYTCFASAKWMREQWHHVAVAWDPNVMVIYIDGVEKARTNYRPPGDLPRQGDLRGAKIMMGDPRPWSSLASGRLTQFDDLAIYGRQLAAKEVFDIFAAARPDLAANVQTPAAAEETAPVLTYRTIAAENKLKVRIDLGAVDLASDRNIPVKLRLAKKGTKETLAARDVVFPELDSEVDFPLAELEDGADYVIAAKIPGAKKISSATLHVPNRMLYAKPLPRDHKVPAPWFPVKRLDETRFGVLDREYTIGANLYPVKAVSRGESVITDAPTFLLGGKAVSWEVPRVVAEHGDFTEFATTGGTDAFRFRGHGELWFDGFYKAEIEVEPKDGAAEIPSLELAWTVPRSAVRYLLTPDWAPWDADGNFSGTFGVNRNNTSVIWTTGPVCGFAWWCASDANWVADGQPTVSIRRGERTASVRVRIIAKPSLLKGVARYTTGVQATPAKRPDPIWRDRWYAGVGGDWTTCNWSSFAGRTALDNMKHVTSLDPAHPKGLDRFLKVTKERNGQDVLAYSMPTHLSDLDEEWDWYYDTWASLPGIRWDFKDEFTGASGRLMPCCPSTAAGDWHVSRAERLFRDHPLMKGLYYDISSCTRCENALHGHGGVDAFGKPYGTSKAMDLRDYFLRIAKLCRKYDRWLHIHAHNLYMPFVHSFGDVCWPGEEQFHLFATNPRYHYVEGIPAEKYEAALNGQIRGMYIMFINQNERVGSQLPLVFAKDAESFIGTNAVYATLMPSLIYDFRDLGGTFGPNEKLYGDLRNLLRPLRLSKSVFHPYWNENYATAADGIRTALYTWEDGEGTHPFMLVVGNFSRTDEKTGVSLDWTKAGTAPRSLKDLLSGRVFTEDELREFTLASHRFLLLAPVDSMR